jgi:cytochrome c peroxidase
MKKAMRDSRISVCSPWALPGKMESTLEQHLNRKLDPRPADLGWLLFFDTSGGLHDDNTCAGCHAPTAHRGDTQ